MVFPDIDSSDPFFRWSWVFLMSQGVTLTCSLVIHLKCISHLNWICIVLIIIITTFYLLTVNIVANKLLWTQYSVLIVLCFIRVLIIFSRVLMRCCPLSFHCPKTCLWGDFGYSELHWGVDEFEGVCSWWPCDRLSFSLSLSNPRCNPGSCNLMSPWHALDTPRPWAG